jgi:hypothetical protein
MLAIGRERSKTRAMPLPNSVDELTPVAIYMAQEMNVNRNSESCREMQRLNAYSADKCIEEYLRGSWWQRVVGIQPDQCVNMQMSQGAAAMMIWTGKVMQGAEWDHKPKLIKKFVSPTTGSGAWHTYGKREYYYDIWSNIHYGYVGKACGFSDSTLLDGAGLEQIGTDIVRMRWPSGASGVRGLRRFDDFSDRLSITMGVQLYSVFPSGVSPANLMSRVLGTPGLSSRPTTNKELQARR